MIGRLYRIVYRKIRLGDVEQLYLFEETMCADDELKLAMLIQNLQVTSACTPVDVDNPAYTLPYYRRIPSAIAYVIQKTAPFLHALSLDLGQHPVMVHAFRTVRFPRLHTLEANHYLLLNPQSIADVNRRLIDAVTERDPNTIVHKTASLPADRVTTNPWPILNTLIIDCRVVIPDLATCTLDYGYIQQEVNVAITQDDGFDWETYQEKYLKRIRLPVNCTAVALVGAPETLEQVTGSRWHPKTVIVPYHGKRFDCIDEPNGIPGTEILMANMSDRDPRLQRFWDIVRETTEGREMAGNIFECQECSALMVQT
ncbi:hypothetical protein VNI00_018503 [Paramarasmius palmivorus]|uniref:Uncharacterized protein n=1 Tax=Paramarasmius palmivorus TaxID=297713 RepID=A0AAW0AXH0_9AGAR